MRDLLPNYGVSVQTGLGRDILLIIRERRRGRALKTFTSETQLRLLSLALFTLGFPAKGHYRDTPLSPALFLTFAHSISSALPSHIPPGGVSRQHYPKHPLKVLRLSNGLWQWDSNRTRPELEIIGQVSGRWWARSVKLISRIER